MQIISWFNCSLCCCNRDTSSKGEVSSEDRQQKVLKTEATDDFQKPLFTFDHYFKEKKSLNDVIQLKPNSLDLQSSAIEQLRTQRLYRLENLDKVYKQLMDHPNQQVASKFFEPTSAWYVGVFQKSTAYSTFEFEMQRIGQKHGIKVISDIRIDVDQGRSLKLVEGKTTDFMLDCEAVIAADSSKGNKSLGAFPQDFVDFSRNGEIRIPVMKKNIEMEPDYIKEKREKRSLEWQAMFDDFEDDSHFLSIGCPFDNRLSLKAIALASSLGITPLMNLTYNEGGNTLIGQREGQPYALIGKDSYVASKLLMKTDLGRKMTHDEIVTAFAIDYGIPKENIYFVEQPGDMHLDMSMAIVGENTILLNDAQEAQRMFSAEQEAWLLEMVQEGESLDDLKNLLEKEVRESSKRKKIEDVTEQDLRKLGFTVIRVPGRFNYNIETHAMNLFNMVTASTSDGKNIVILLGCVKEYQVKFEQILRKCFDRKIDKFYFLDEESSQESLALDGGISCRTKTIPFDVLKSRISNVNNAR